MLKMRTYVLLPLLAVLLGGGALADPPIAAVPLVGVVNPPMVQLAANQLVGVTYIFQNPSSTSVTLVTSTAAFYVADVPITSVTVPVTLTVPAHSTVTLASNVSISESLVQAAKARATDRIRMVRTFENPGARTHVSVPIWIRVGNSMIGPASVTEILLDVPQDSRTVAQFDEIRGHAFIRGSGTGAISGTWFVDGNPIETFNVNMLAGIPVEVSTRESLTTQDLGEHQVELRVTTPALVSSNPRRYVVVPGDAGNQRVFLVAPRQDAGVAPDQARVSYRWAPMPGASGYEIAFSPVLDPLGLDADGDVKQGIFGPMEWTPMLESMGHLMLLVKAPGDTVVWTPNPQQYARIFGLTRSMYWAVRAVYPGQEHADPSTTSKPGRLLLIPTVGPLSLSSPATGAIVPGIFPTFEWQAGPAGSVYEITLSANGKSVFSAATSETRYSLDDMSDFRLSAGQYSWQVRAMLPGEGIVAKSEQRSFSVAAGSATSAPNAGRFVRPANSIRQVASIMSFVPLPSAVDSIKFTPADGGKVESQQPEMGATYPDAQPGKVRFILDGVDVTGLSKIGQSSLTFGSVRPLSEGEHTLGLILITLKNEKFQSTGKFSVEPAKGQSVAKIPEEPDTEADQADLPMNLQVDSRWEGTDEQATSDAFNMDANLRGQRKWTWNKDSYTATNFQLSRPSGQGLGLTNFIVEMGINNDRYKARAGDIGGSESPFTVNGLASRAFSFSTNAGPIKLAATRTLGDGLNQSSIGRSPDLFLITAENAGATDSKGLKLIYVDSKDGFDGNNNGFAGPTQSRVLSITGRSPLGKTGISLHGELANSNGTFETVLGTQEANGTALSLGIGGNVKGFEVSTSYRRIGAQFASPASTTLTNDLRGWELKIGRQIGKSVSSAYTYTALDNTGGSQTPDSSVTSQAVDLTFNFPKLPSVTAQLARNRTSSDAAIPGTLPSANEENVWSLTANYGLANWNAYLSYSNSDFEDKYDGLQLQQNPGIYTPNSRSGGTWAGGVSYQPSKAWRFRGDFGSNTMDRFFRDSNTIILLQEGTDGSNQFRFEAEYRPAGNLSATLAWSKSRSDDVLNLNDSDATNLDMKVNYCLTRPGGKGRFYITAGWLRSNGGGAIPGGDQNDFSIMVNDSRLLSFGF